MKALTEAELRMNEDAVGVATSVLGETVEAAARCEQVTQDMTLETADAVNRGFAKGAKAMSRLMASRKVAGIKSVENGALPKSFVLAVTADKVFAIEDKHGDGKLLRGKVLKSWDRKGFVAKGSSSPGPSVPSGVPDDRQLLIIYVPIEGGRSAYMEAAARQTAASRSPGMPHRVALAKDAASRHVIEAVECRVTPGASVVIDEQTLHDPRAQNGASVVIDEQTLHDPRAQNGASADPLDRLGKLADLRDRGVLNDEEFAAQKAKILGTS